MAWSGSGVFSRVYNWVSDANTGIDIEATRMDGEDDNLAAGINNCLAKDGQNSATGNLNLGGNRITNGANGTSAGDFATVAQAQTQTNTYVITTGSADAYVATPSPAFASYAAGQTLRIKANFSNTGACTINVSGLGAKSIKLSNGSDPDANDIVADGVYEITYDGTNFQIIGKKETPGKNTIWIPAAAMRPTITGGCAALDLAEISSTQPNIAFLAFDASTDESAQFAIAFPKSWDEGTVTAQFMWAHPSTTTNFAVVWALQGVAISDDDAIGASYGTAISVTDTGGTTDDLYVSAETSAITIAGTPAAGDLCYFRVFRDADNGSDTLAVDARLIGIKLLFNTTTFKDD